MMIMVLFATTINITDNLVGDFSRKLPVIKSTWVHYRLTSLYILPTIIISCMLLDRISFNHKVSYRHGLMKEESSKLLKDFFKNRR